VHYVLFIAHQHRDPDKGPNSPEHLRKVGLADLIPNAVATAVHPGQNFPNNEGGTRYHWDRTEASINGDPAELVWVPAEARGGLAAERYWIGYRADDPPTADDLRRKECPLTLFVTQQWSDWPIPAAAKIPADYVMPKGSGGKTVKDIPDRWREFWNRACDYQQAIAVAAVADNGTADHVQTLLETRGEAWWEFIHFVLNIAYRMPVELMFALRLLNTENCTVPVLIATGGLITDEITKAVEEAMKKKLAATTGIGEDTLLGGEGSTATTGPT
jgi:hypothetical protein